MKEDFMPYRVEYHAGYRNSKGERAPWVIINEERDEIVGSSATRSMAEASVRARLAAEHGGFKGGRRAKVRSPG